MWDSGPASADAFERFSADSESILSKCRHGPFDLWPECDIHDPRPVVDGIDSRGFADPDAFAIDGHDFEAFALYPVIIHRVVLDRVCPNDDQGSC